MGKFARVLLVLQVFAEDVVVFVGCWGFGLLVLAFVLLNRWVGLGYLAGCGVVGR